MANQVFANNREISCKAADGKSIAAFADVCFTPPQAPPTPLGVPIPYPNTGLAKDTTKGSRSVKVSGKEVILKDQSHYKTSYGDEAGCAPKKGVVTSRNKGKVYFTSWSMNVKFEGKNLVRHLDLTTHNHASMPGNTPIWPYLDQVAMGQNNDACKDNISKEKEACKEFAPHQKNGPSPCPSDGKPNSSEAAEAYSDKIAKNQCLTARRCQLTPYQPSNCCPGQTGHHLVEAGSFYNVGRGGKKSIAVKDSASYDHNKAPCLCVEGCNQYHGTHGLMHTFQGSAAKKSGAKVESIPLEDGTSIEHVALRYGQAKSFGVAAVGKTFPESGCDPKCLEAQLDAYHNSCGINDDTHCRAIITGYTGDEAENSAIRAVSARSRRVKHTHISSHKAR